MSTAPTTARGEAARLPRQIPFIIGNEACERFSFYGMRNILTVFLVDYLLRSEVPEVEVRERLAKDHFHTFVAGVYLFPLLGGYLADRFWGRYRTVLWLSLVYCGGCGCLALFHAHKVGFLLGLFLIALGSGGIKPCVSAMVGDQFDDRNKHLASGVFGAFYWSINFGSLFASLFVPLLLTHHGPVWAFGVPGVLMFISTVIFWAGRNYYVKPPPTGANPHSFTRVLWTAWKMRGRGASAWGGAEQWHPASSVAGVRAVLRVLLVFAPIPFFWALFDQKASTWVLQARQMDPVVGGFVFQPAQMQFINPALVMLLIPLMQGVVYPLARRVGYELTPLRRMVSGMFLAVLSWVAAGAIQVPIDRGESLSILWQFGPYVLLTLAEVLVSTTGLEFAYSQAPPEMKGTLMSFWTCTVAVANLGVAKLGRFVPFTGAGLFFFYAACCLVAAVALGLIARRYRMVDYYRRA